MITKTTFKIWRLFYCCNLGWDSLRLLQKYYRYIKILVLFWFAKVWAPDIQKNMKYDYFIKKNVKMLKSRFLKKSPKSCDQNFHLFKADVSLWYHSDHMISHVHTLSSTNEIFSCKLLHQIFNNALRGLPRGNEVDGLPRVSSWGSSRTDITLQFLKQKL